MAKASIRNAKLEDLVPGAVIRMSFTDLDTGKAEPTCSSFSDCIITKVEGEGLNAMVFLSRVWARFRNGEVTYTSETFSAEAFRLVDKTHWQLVINDRGNPENYAR